MPRLTNRDSASNTVTDKPSLRPAGSFRFSDRFVALMRASCAEEISIEFRSGFRKPAISQTEISLMSKVPSPQTAPLRTASPHPWLARDANAPSSRKRARSHRPRRIHHCSSTARRQLGAIRSVAADDAAWQGSLSVRQSHEHVRSPRPARKREARISIYLQCPNIPSPAAEPAPPGRRHQRNSNTPRTVTLTVPLPALIGVSAGRARTIFSAAR